MAKFIRGLYYLSTPIEKQMRLMGISAKIVMDEKITFDIDDELNHWKRKIMFWKKNVADDEFFSMSQRIFRKGEELVKNEANLFTIIQTI